MPDPGPEPRVRVQAAAGLDAILAPRSVAVIGASADPASVGHALLRSIKEGGFAGPVHPVHPRAAQVLGLPAFRSVADIPGPVDLAVVAVPASAVLAVAEECGRKGVGGLVVVTAGFRESDAAGAERERQLASIVARYRMRMVGPNCLGVVNNSPSVDLHATFAPRPLLRGSTALVTQSGAVGIALMEHAWRTGLGISRFVSMGNKTDVSGNDLLLRWEEDPEVGQVLMYLENFGNPRNFVRIARRLTKRKPVVVIKSGRTAKGARAAGTHTGALMQADALVDALLDQCGVLRVGSVEELFDVAQVLASQPPLAGPRIAIVTNSGGPAILAADALEQAGLQLADLSLSTKDAIARHLPAESHPENPVDLLAGGTPEAFEACLDAVMRDPGVDGVLAIWTPLHEHQAAQAQAIGRALGRPDASAPGKAEAQGPSGRKPGVAVAFGHGPGTPAFEALKHAGVPAFTFPESAVDGLQALRAVAAWRQRPDEAPASLAVQRAEAAALVAAARCDPDGWLGMADALRLMALYGIPVPRHERVATAEDALAAAGRIGYPVVLKVEAPGVVHKTEFGAVRLGLSDPAALQQAFRDAWDGLAARGMPPTGALVMETVASAPEILVGGKQDALFGPVVACGAGGIYTEVIKDVRFLLAPASAEAAEALLGRLRMSGMLKGHRGQPPSDMQALAEVLARVALLVADFPGIAELEANPVRALPTGAVALDARVRLASASVAGAPPARPLS